METSTSKKHWTVQDVCGTHDFEKMSALIKFQRDNCILRGHYSNGTSLDTNLTHQNAELCGTELFFQKASFRYMVLTTYSRGVNLTIRLDSDSWGSHLIQIDFRFKRILDRISRKGGTILSLLLQYSVPNHSLLSLFHWNTIWNTNGN